MVNEARVYFFLCSLFFVRSEIYLYNTNDGLKIEFYDCVRLQSLDYCRRPKDPIDLFRDNDTLSCKQNGGQVRQFSDIRSKNTTVSTILHKWRSSIERVERYARYLRDPNELDEYLCECHHPSSFGGNCEYQLPVGQTFEETLKWQLVMRKNQSEKVQIYGDVVCYDTLKCDSGVLCLDWREICDGIQQCMLGKDEENCDLLEMNRCDEDEYRCMNGMCVPEEFFLDGELDCLDWSDEMPFKESEDCFDESASSECDDHICSPNSWSCGDGQCTSHRLAFQRSTSNTICHSRRDQYFICETHEAKRQWTMPNGRCYGDRQYQASSVANVSKGGQCEYLLKCSLSESVEIGCPCDDARSCFVKLDLVCPLALIEYPRGRFFAPFLSFFYNRTRAYLWNRYKLPHVLMINGTVRCGDSFVTVRKTISVDRDRDLDERRMIEEHFCRPFRNSSSLENVQSGFGHQCHHANESINPCGEWNPCLSITRLNDGSKNCANGRDEDERRDTQILTSCAHVQRHRFRCSREQATCLSVMTLGDADVDCRNKFDQRWFGNGRELSSVNCNDQKQDECSLLRQYIQQSWTSINRTETPLEGRIPFRSYCDTFWDLHSRDDEDLLECEHWWICPKDQNRCQTGQCLEHRWINDSEWDCADASDEYDQLQRSTKLALRGASRHNFTNRSYLVPSRCNQSHPYLCLSARATERGFSCFNLSQIGDGRIDCLGAQDERNILRRCSESSSLTLGSHFLCRSTNHCIPYRLHCLKDHRCPRRSDDELWCSLQEHSSNCSDSNGFACLDGKCLKSGRCNSHSDCTFGEDEYMCDHPSTSRRSLVPYREAKRFSQRMTKHTLGLSLYPSVTKTRKLASYSISAVRPAANLISSSFSPYWCNRGLGVLSTKNHSKILCFCPPQYYGDKCQFHQDRLSVVLYLNLSQSIYSSSETHPTHVLKLVVIFLLNNEVLIIDQFHLPSSFEPTTVDRTKFIAHFPYSHSSPSLEERRQRFFNRSSLLSVHPYSIRIELYRTRLNERPSMMAVWKYTVDFDHLPVFRLAKVLHLIDSSSRDHLNPCSSRPCRTNEECHPLMNDESLFVCLCKTNYSRETCSEESRRDYCSQGSLCQPDSSSPPFYLCPLNRFGRRCEIEHDACLSNPCQNNGSCVPDIQPDQVMCLCTREYRGTHCQWRKSSISLSISETPSHQGAVIQYFQIDFASLDVILVRQQVFRTFPHRIEYFHPEQTNIPDIVLAKVYSSDEVSSPDLYLLSMHLNMFSFHGTTQISPINQCEHRRAFSNDSSPIQYHQICIHDPNRLCFRDDFYLCLCADKNSRVECFIYDDQLDRCDHCLANGRCLKGTPHRSKDFLCLCPSCHSGQQCQFNTKSFSFTLDQLFSSDLLSDQRQTATIALMIFFSLLGFFLSIPNNLFSFLTLRRRSCLCYGVGHYLLWMSVVNQLGLVLLAARLIHLTVIITLSRSSFLTDNLFCKLLSYLLTCTTRLSAWLPSFVALERVCTTIFLNKHWFRQPRIARTLMFFTLVVILLSSLDELVFVKSFTSTENGNSAMCVIEYPSTRRSMWISIHQIVSVIHFLFPLLINLCSTLTIMGIVIKNKMNIQGAKYSTSNEVHIDHGNVFRNVLHENREMITRPAITLIPSIFSLFSLPFLIISFSLGCQNLDENPLRYLLITFYLVTLIPQMLMFCLYIYPSSLYRKEWQSTTISQRITALRHRPSSKNLISLNSTVNESKSRDLPSLPSWK